MRKRIGLVLHNIHEEYSVELIKGVKRFCKENSIQLILFPINSKLSEKFNFEYRNHAIKELINKSNLDGVIFSAGTLCSFITKKDFKNELDKLSDIPIVNIGINIPGYSFVTSDTKQAFKKMVSHIIEKHNRKKFLVFTSYDNNSDSLLRKKWLIEVLNSHNIELKENQIINAQFNRLSAKLKIQDYVNKNGLNFDSIVCLNDSMAFGIIEGLNELNYTAPKDYIIVGFDNSNRATFSIPTLSTIDPRIAEQGYQAGKIIKELFTSPNSKITTTIDGKEKYRVSCGCISDKDLSYDYIDDSNNIAKFSDKDIYNIVHLHPQSANLELYILHQLIQTSLTVVNQEQLFNMMPKYIKYSSLKGIAIFSYDKPKLYSSTKRKFFIPQKTKRIFSYEINTDNPNINEEYINPLVNFFPENTFNEEYDEILIYPLFEGKYQYGYIIAPLNDKNYLFYEVLFELFSKEITSAIKLSNEQITNSKLESKNTKLKIHSSKLDTLSNTDELTQINNRRGFMNLVTKMIKNSISNNRTGLIIFCDMDGLKKINDTYGHEAGDKAIIMQTQILQNSIRSTDIIGRLGGDEFAIAVEGMTLESFKKFKQKVINNTKIVNKNSNEKFEVSVSLGAAEYSIDNPNIDKLLSIADNELYKEKTMKKSKN